MIQARKTIEDRAVDLVPSRQEATQPAQSKDPSPCGNIPSLPFVQSSSIGHQASVGMPLPQKRGTNNQERLVEATKLPNILTMMSSESSSESGQSPVHQQPTIKKSLTQQEGVNVKDLFTLHKSKGIDKLIIQK